MGRTLQLTVGVSAELAKLVRHRQAMEHHSNMRQLIYERMKVAHRTAFLPSSNTQWPIDHINKVASHFNLVHFPLYLDPPRYLMEDSGRRRKIYDEFGRLLYMAPKPMPKKIKAEDFAPLPTFEQVFVTHPDPANATAEEKRDRVLMYLDMYSNSGMITPSAKAVGVSYMQLLLWINESPDFQQMALLANTGAKQIMLDVGRARALQGDSGLLRFFLEADNPELRKNKGSGGKGAGDMPEGVTQEAIALALGQVKEAERIKVERVLLPPEGEGGEYIGHEKLIVSGPMDILHLVNQTAASLTPPSKAAPTQYVDMPMGDE